MAYNIWIREGYLVLNLVFIMLLLRLLNFNSNIFDFLNDLHNKIFIEKSKMKLLALSVAIIVSLFFCIGNYILIK